MNPLTEITKVKRFRFRYDLKVRYYKMSKPNRLSKLYPRTSLTQITISIFSEFFSLYLAPNDIFKNTAFLLQPRFSTFQTPDLEFNRFGCPVKEA